MLLFFSGFSILICFLGCAVYLSKNKEGLRYEQITLSGIAANKSYINVVRFFCWNVSLLTFPFIFQLKTLFGLEYLSPTVGIGFLASISLFLTALTINRPDWWLHIIASYTFYISLLLLPLEIALRLTSDSNAIYGWSILIINITIAILSISHMTKRNRVPNGITELIVMGGNAIWVIIFSLLGVFTL